MYIVWTNRGFIKEVIHDSNPYKDKDLPSKRYSFTIYRKYAKQFKKESEAIKCALLFNGEVQLIENINEIKSVSNAQLKALQKRVLKYLYTNEIKIKDFNEQVNITDSQSYSFRNGQTVSKKVIKKIEIFIQNTQ